MGWSMPYRTQVEQVVERKLLAFENEELEGNVEEWKREAGSVPDFPPGVPPPSPPPSLLHPLLDPRCLAFGCALHQSAGPGTASVTSPWPTPCGRTASTTSEEPARGA